MLLNSPSPNKCFPPSTYGEKSCICLSNNTLFVFFFLPTVQRRWRCILCHHASYWNHNRAVDGSKKSCSLEYFVTNNTTITNSVCCFSFPTVQWRWSCILCYHASYWNHCRAVGGSKKSRSLEYFDTNSTTITNSVCCYSFFLQYNGGGAAFFAIMLAIGTIVELCALGFFGWIFNSGLDVSIFSQRSHSDILLYTCVKKQNKTKQKQKMCEKRGCSRMHKAGNVFRSLKCYFSRKWGWFCQN